MIINCWFDEVEQKEKVTDIRWTDSDGKLHHENGPAVVRANGHKEWYVRGKLHRDDGPAIEWANGHKDWYVHGVRHRDDGPAFESAAGTKIWYVHGKLHRDNGPAVVRADGNKEWYTNGELCTEKILKQKKLQPQPYTWMVPNYVAWWKRHLGATHDS